MQAEEHELTRAMNGPLQALAERLKRIAQDGFTQDTLLGQPAEMRKELQRVKAAHDSHGSARPPVDRILNAISSFIQTNSCRDDYHARLIAWGLTVPRGSARPLIEHDGSCIAFLNGLRDRLSQECFSPSLWRGLLSSYFAYAGPYSSDPIGHRNWIKLRTLLRDSFQSMFERKPQKSDWMLALRENLNLFDDNSCQTYAAEALEGDCETVKRLRQLVQIPETSWFTAELVRAQIERACSKDDLLFKGYIPRLCKLLRDNSLYSDKGLAAILTRYHSSSDTSEDVDLGRLAVDLWDNPKLPRSVRWNQVNPEIKGMVLKWLISKDLRTFFDLFSRDENAHQDKRRLNFWMRYIDHIRDAYFVLGSHAANSKNEDYMEMRRSNKGRISRLDQEGPQKRNNNAFIMLIDRYAIVEFGQSGNACLCFDAENLPFRLDSPWLRGDKSQLKNDKHSGCKFRLIHMDRSRRDWEDDFQHELQRLGILPGTYPTLDTRRFVKMRIEARGRATNLNPAQSNRRVRTFTTNQLRQFAARLGLTIEDNRDRGGCLWVKEELQFDGSPEWDRIRAQLQEWGFRWKPGKGWWHS